MATCCLCFPVVLGSTPFYLCLAYSLLLAEGLWYWFAYADLVPLLWKIVVLATAGAGLLGAVLGTAGLHWRWGEAAFVTLTCYGVVALLVDVGYLVIDAIYAKDESFNCYFCGYTSEGVSIAITVLIDFFCIAMPQANAVRIYWRLAYNPPAAFRPQTLFDVEDDEALRLVESQPAYPATRQRQVKPQDSMTARPSRRPYVGLEAYEFESESDPESAEREAAWVPRDRANASRYGR